MKLRSTLLTIVQFAIGIGLEYWLISSTLKHSHARLGDIFGTALLPPLILATLLFGLVILLTSWRWSLLLRVQGVRLPFLQVLRLSFIGQFFNIALPGAVSGDFVKMACIAKAAPERTAESILTIMLDRILGMLGMFFMASLFVLVYLSFLSGLGPDQRAVQLAAFVVGAGSIAGILGVLAVEFRRQLLALPLIRTLVPAVAKRLPHKVNDIFGRLAAALELYRQHRGAIVAGFAISVVVHSCLALIFVCGGVALGEAHVPAGGYFLSSQVAHAVAAIPLTPGGLGARDGVICLFLKAQGCKPELAGMIPVIYSLILLFWSVVGGLVFIFSPRGKKAGGKNGSDVTPTG